MDGPPEFQSPQLRRLTLAARAPGLEAASFTALAAESPDLALLECPDSAALARLGLKCSAIDWLMHPDEMRVAADLRWLRESGCLLLPCFAADFARLGLTITSGLALGIDAACHEGALDADGSTVAVLGHGLDEVYPREHQDLARRVATTGALISEFPPGTPPLTHHFPRRNRIIAGLAQGTLVVEAAGNSGSLITARLAGVAGRDVFAIPGSIHNEMARGCHELIRQGAKLVERPDDVLAELKISLAAQLLVSPAADPVGTRLAAGALDKEYKILLDALAFEPVSVDSLIERTGMNSESIASMLLILELDGHVAPHPGGRYSRLAER
jgi:DNA processing protein